MIGLVRLALRRPYTSAVAAMLILLLGALSVTRMIVDIFPVIDIPVVLVAWSYNGLTAEDMERRVVFITERAYSTTVNGISRIESQSIPSIGLLQVYFQPGTDIGSAIAQITSVNNSILRIAPPGMQPPAVIQFNASNVPVVQMTLSSKTLTEQQILRLQPELHPREAVHHPRPFDAWPRSAGSRGRSTWTSTRPRLQAKGFSPDRRRDALQSLQCDRPCRYRAYRQTASTTSIEFEPQSGRSVQRPADQELSTARRCRWAMSRTSATASPTRQTSCTSTASAPTYLAILKHADASTLAVVDSTREALPDDPGGRTRTASN